MWESWPFLNLTVNFNYYVSSYYHPNCQESLALCNEIFKKRSHLVSRLWLLKLCTIKTIIWRLCQKVPFLNIHVYLHIFGVEKERVGVQEPELSVWKIIFAKSVTVLRMVDFVNKVLHFESDILHMQHKALSFFYTYISSLLPLPPPSLGLKKKTLI